VIVFGKALAIVVFLAMSEGAVWRTVALFEAVTASLLAGSLFL
jgi:hypothetical protein